MVQTEVVCVGSGTEVGSTGRDSRASLLVANQVKRNRVTNFGTHVEILGPTKFAVEPPTDPARAGDRVWSTCHPVGHRVEVRQVWVLVADPLDDSELALVPESFHLSQGRVEPDIAVERQRLTAGNRQTTVLGVVVAVVERDHRIQPVVAAVHCDHQKDPIVLPDRTGRPRRGVIAGRQHVKQSR